MRAPCGAPRRVVGTGRVAPARVAAPLQARRVTTAAAKGESFWFGFKAPVGYARWSRPPIRRMSAQCAFVEGLTGTSVEGVEATAPAPPLAAVSAGGGPPQETRAPTHSPSPPSPPPSVSGYIKLALPAGKANPAPPVGPALGAKVRGEEEKRGRAGSVLAWRLGCPALGMWQRLLTRLRQLGGEDAQAGRGQRARRGTDFSPPAAPKTEKKKKKKTPPLSPPTPHPSDLHPPPNPQGVNIMDFCKQYNAATANKTGTIIPVEITVYEDRSFTFILKTPPASVLLAKAAGIEKGSGNPKEIVGKVTRAQLQEIANIKLPDLNATGVEPAMRIIEGTAKNMGIEVVEA